MDDKIKQALIDLLSAIRAGKIYTLEHPRFQDFIERTYKNLTGALEEKNEIILGIVEDEIAIEDEILFDLSKKVKALILHLVARGIQKIVIHRDLQKDELVHFISVLVTPDKQVERDIPERLILLGVRNIEIGKIRAPLSAEQEKGIEKAERAIETISDDALEKISQTVAKVLNEEAIDYLDLRFNLLNFMEYFTGNHQELLNLITMKKKDLATFLHLLNVSLLSMYFASRLGYSRNDVLDIGIVGLFHDIGKLSIARKLIKKKERLDEEEFTQIKHHSILGAKLLFRYVDSLGLLPILGAFEHHIRYDQKGYPLLSYPRQPHPVSQIISVCDVYDALNLKRTYKKDYPPLKIYNIMTKEKGKYFDPQLLDQFFSFMGVWPVGSIVSLNDGRVAIVRKANPDDIFRPQVQIIAPEREEEWIDLAEKKDSLEIVSALNAFKDGKKYLNLV